QPMILIIASRFDRRAPALAARWHAHGAQVVTGTALSTAGWRYRAGAAEGAAVAGVAVPVDAITGVLTLVPAITVDELPQIIASDREYVAAEMSAFLRAWLAALPCPVINRPTPTALAGPG